MNNKKEKSTKQIIFLVLEIIFLIGFLICVGYLIKYLIQNNQSQNTMEDLKDNYVSYLEPTPISTPEPSVVEEINEPTEEELAAIAAAEAEALRQELLTKYNVPNKEIDFKALQEETNPHIYAWITIQDTVIDYPVLQHPDLIDYYLEYNIDGSYGRPGAIYTQYINSTDFTDKLTLIYGHNMSVGTMFANLHYFEDKTFFDEHPYFYIYTEDAILVYQVFAAYADTNMHQIYTNDISTDEKFLTYIDAIYEKSGKNNQYNLELRDTFTPDSKIVSLSTCIKNQSDKRWLVAGVLQEKIPYEDKQGEQISDSANLD